MNEREPARAFRVGVAGPVSSGKTALVDRLSRQLCPRYSLAVVTNDIYTKEDAEFLLRQGVHPAETSITFISEASLSTGLAQKLELEKMIAPVRNCRRIGKKDMILNDATPRIEVNPETYEVRVDGDLISCEPARVLPLAQRYFLF